MTKHNVFFTALFICIFGFVYSGNRETADSLYEIGVSKLKHLKRLEAKDAFSSALVAYPKHVGSLYERALISKHFLEYDLALRDFGEVTVLGSGKEKINSHFEAGKILVLQEKFAASITHFDAVLNEDQTNEEAYFLRGNSKHLSKDYAGAIADFDKASTLNSNNIENYYRKGLSTVELEKYPEAIEIFTKVLKMESGHSDAYFYRAYSHYQLGIKAHEKHKKQHFKESLADYDKALSLDDKIEEAYFDRGEVKMELHDYVGAIHDFKMAIEINPKDLEAHYQKAMCNYHYGYEEIAAKELEEIIMMDSTYTNALYTLGVYHYEIQSFDRAIVEFDKLLSIEEDKDGFFYRGLAKLEKSDLNGACVDLKKAEDLGAEVLKSIYHSAKCVINESN